MAKRINRNKVTTTKRKVRTYSKINSPNSNKQSKGSAKTSTPSSVGRKTVANNGRRNNVTKTVNNANKALNKSIDNLFKPKQVTTNNPKSRAGKTAIRNKYKTPPVKQSISTPYSNSYMQEQFNFKNQKKYKYTDPYKNSHLHNVPSVFGGTMGEDLEAKTEVDYQLNTGLISMPHSNKMKELENILSSHFSSTDEFASWFESNSNNGVLKATAKLPFELDTSEEYIWNYYMKYGRTLEFTTKQKIAEEEERKGYTVDYHDYSADTTNSYFDIVRNYLNSYLHGDAYKANRDLFKDIKDYHKRYIFNPLAKGDFGTFGWNVLFNLSESLDILATAPKAILKGGYTTVYGTGTRLIDGQEYWVYSGGKDTQKELIDLGAMDLITYGDEFVQRGKHKHNPKVIEGRLKNAGLWEEYLKLKEEYSSADLTGSGIMEELVNAYTSHENYEFDTGYRGLDFISEMLVDPSLVIGGISKSITSGGVKALTRTGVKEGLKAAQNSAPLLKELDEIMALSEEIAKTYYKDLGESVFSASTKYGTLDNNVKSIANVFEAQGLITRQHKSIFIKQTLDTIKKDMTSAQFKVIEGARALDITLNAVDSAVLKSIFAAPYLGYKALKAGKSVLNEVALKQAVSRVTDGLYNADGRITIDNLENIVSRTSTEYMAGGASFEEFQEITLSAITATSKEDVAYLKVIKNGLDSVDDLEALNVSINGAISNITNGRFTNIIVFKEHLENLKLEHYRANNSVVRICNDYITELDSLLRQKELVTQAKIKDFYKELTKIKDEESYLQLFAKAQSQKGYLPDDFFSKLDNIRIDFSRETIDRAIRDFEVKSNKTVKDVNPAINDFNEIVTPYDNGDLLMKGTMTEDAKRAFNTLPDLTLKADELTPKGYLDLLSFLKNVRKNSNNIDLRDFITAAQKFSATYILREAQNLLTKSEKHFKNKLDRLTASINTQELSTFVTRDAQIVKMQADKLAVFDRFLADTNLKEITQYFVNSKNDVHDFMEYVNRAPVDALEELDKQVGIVNFSKKCKQFYQELEVVNAVTGLRNDLVLIPERERWAVLETLFGISKGSPQNYVNLSSLQRQDLVDGVNLWLSSNYGESTVSLDGFSKQASNFNNEFYKPFYEELQDSKVQQRILNFLEGGHLNPIKDVQKQMFQIILKDPTSVKSYNEMCVIKDVYFTDIETQGFNTSRHDITSIATKRWVPIPEGASLSEILDILEDPSTEVLHKATYDPEELTKYVSDDLLDATFKSDNTLRHAPRDMRLEKYIETYGVKPGDEIVKEENILADFLNRLDESCMNHNKEIPTLVVHNNNGFDMNYIRARCIKHKLYPEIIPHLDALSKASENTIARLKGLEDDIILTQESADLIIDSVERFMNTIKAKSDMRLFSSRKIRKALTMFKYDIPDVLDNLTDSVFSALKQASEAGEFDKLCDQFLDSSEGIMKEMSMFDNNIISNPCRLATDNLQSDVWENIYTPEHINNLMRTIREMNDAPYAPLAYTILFDDIKVSKFFNYGSEILLSEVQLKGMQDFTERITHTVNYRLKANDLLADGYADYISIIRYVKEYAAHLKDWDEYSFLKYISEPTSVDEAYVVAQQLWDLFYTPYNKTQILELVEYTNKQISDKVPTQFSEGLTELEEGMKYKYKLLFGDVFNLDSVVSEETRRILNDFSKQYHCEIYKDVPKQYITTFMTDIVKDNIAFRKMLNASKAQIKEYDEVAQWLELSEYASVSDKMYLQSQSKYVDFLTKLEKALVYDNDMLNDILKYANKELDERRIAMSLQILKNVTKSEDALISHLVHHNQFLNIALKSANVEYEQLVQTLIKCLREDYSDNIVYTIREGMLHIGLAKHNVLEKVTDTQFKFKGSDKLYDAPEYERITSSLSKQDYFNKLDVLKELAQEYDELDDYIFRLTEGKSAGSVGALHTYSKQLEMYKLLPNEFLSRCLSEAHTCDSKLWHGASFDMTNLGDAAHCWKYGSNNDVDPIIIMKEVMEEFANRTKTGRYIMDTMFNTSSELTLKNMFGEYLSPIQKLKVIQSMSDYTCVILKPAPTKSGYAVSEVAVDSEKALALAEEANAIFVPYDNFLQLQEMINQEELSNVAIKALAKYCTLLKTGMIMFTGTWIRNWVDATIKTAGDTGSLTEAVKYQCVAASLIKDYNKVIKHFEKTRGLSYMSMNTIRREFDSIPGIQISFEQFEFLEGWFKNSISGGQSSLVKAILQNSQGNINTALKSGHTKTFKQRRNTIQQADIIASELERFLDLPSTEIESLLKELNEADFMYYGLSKERFLEGFENLDLLTPTEYVAWNRLANDLIQIRSKRLTHRSFRSVGFQTIDNLLSKAMTPMSRVEELVRLSEYLALDAQGYKRGEIFKKIVDTHFNYDMKTNSEKILEFFIPFFTYEKCNALYWVKQLDQNPRMLRYLEHIWGELSWSNEGMSAEERAENIGLSNILQSGNIPLGDSGLYIKANPSFIGALDYLVGGPDVYISKLSLPLQFLSKAGMYELGADSHSFFAELNLNSDNALGELITVEHLAQLVPIASSIYDKFDRAFAIFDDDATYLKLKEYAQHGWQGALVRLFPSIFGAVKCWDNFGTFEQHTGEDWDAYCRRVQIKTGRIWDNNQRKFVMPDDCIPGLLNNKDLSWEEVNYYNFILFGTMYDSNQNAWVELGKDSYITGGLNRNDLTWDELCSLQYAVNGKVWDYDKNAFVKIADPQVIYQFPEPLESADSEMLRGDGESILSKLGIIAPVYADTIIKAANTKVNIPLKDEDGNYILTGDAEHDNKVFELMKAEVSVPSTGNANYMRYRNDIASGFKYKATNFIPSRPKGIPYIKKQYGKPYSAGKNLAGLRMATSNYTAYDLYYDYDYSYKYQYRNAVQNYVNYPKNQLEIQRYMRLRGDYLLRDFQNRNKYNLSNTHSVTGLPVSQRLHKIKHFYYNR